MTDTLDLAVIGGDGIGPEVVAEGLKVLDAARTAPGGPKVSTTEYDLGARRWHATGETLPDSVLEELKRHDAILLGAIGDPSVPERACSSAGCCCKLRFALDHYVNLRPARLYPGVGSPLASNGAPASIDFVVVREGTEGPYVGNGGALRAGTPHEIATEVSVNTAFGVERVVRDAFAPRPGPPAQAPHAGAQAQRARATPATSGGAPSRRSARSSPTSDRDYLHVDAATIFLVTDPARFDVIVTDNLFGDIITDLAGGHRRRHRARRQRQHQPGAHRARACSSRCTARRRTSPASGKADPTAAILSVALLLEHLGPAERRGRAIEAAVAADLAERGDRRESATTAEVGDAIAAARRPSRSRPATAPCAAR